MKYDDIDSSKKEQIIKDMYENQRKSFADIAKELGTYSNKIRRDAIGYGISIRDKREAQKNAIKTGKHKHPTKGSQRTEETKLKIGKKIMESWNSLTSKDLEKRKKKAKDNWEKKSEDEKKYMQSQANKAVRKSSKEGSKLEKFILNKLISDGFTVRFHEEQILSNTKLQIDIFLPSINTAIEIDGPSHFSPVWGDDVLSRNIKYDSKKTGLIIGKGLYLVRIKQTYDYSKSRATNIYEKLKNILDNLDASIKQYTIED